MTRRSSPGRGRQVHEIIAPSRDAQARLDCPAVSVPGWLVDQGESCVDIKRKVSSESGSAATFTGAVHVDRPIAPSPAAGADWRIVTFEPAARTAWHTHPKGQILIVTAGSGRVQREGGPIEEIRPGDVVLIPADEKHWHGASPTAAMTHVAINEAPTKWMDKVADEQYEA
jgi:quercetin dioxygenase-like cupin family protein